MDFIRVDRSFVDDLDFCCFVAVGLGSSSPITILSGLMSASLQSWVSEMTVNGAGGRWRCGEYNSCIVRLHPRPVDSRDQLLMEWSGRRRSTHPLESKG